jgi:LemA protein
MVPALIIGGVVLLIVLWVALTYNALIRTRLQTQNTWSNIDVQLKRRHDLIPNLVNTVKGYAAHEKDTLERVVKARQQAVEAKTVGERAAAENLLTGALRQVFALAEAYPDLKANQNFLQLQQELASTETRITAARQEYNRAVTAYNTKLQTVPSNLIASTFNFEPREFFEIETPEERGVPQVQF